MTFEQKLALLKYASQPGSNLGRFAGTPRAQRAMANYSNQGGPGVLNTGQDFWSGGGRDTWIDKGTKGLENMASSTVGAVKNTINSGIQGIKNIKSSITNSWNDLKNQVSQANPFNVVQNAVKLPGQ